MSNRVNQRFSFDSNAQLVQQSGGFMRLKQGDNGIIQHMQEDQEERMKTKIQLLKIQLRKKNQRQVRYGSVQNEQPSRLKFNDT